MPVISLHSPYEPVKWRAGQRETERERERGRERERKREREKERKRERERKLKGNECRVVVKSAVASLTPALKTA